MTRATPRLIAALVLSTVSGCGADRAPALNIIVLGFDGMDHELTQAMIEEGRLPNFARLASQGTFQPLATSMPPQSPVAWSNFLTGMDAGGHGIFDFIHRDPETMIPYLSTTRTEASTRKLTLGSWQLPLGSDTIELLRRGTPFWEPLEENGVETTILRIPANFPPSGTASRELSGMGTPDVIGSYGTFSYYTTDGLTWAGKKVTGGDIYVVSVVDGVVHGTLHGPPNPFRVGSPDVTADFSVHIDPEHSAIKLAIGGEEAVLMVGEWSEWLPVELDLIPTQTIHAAARFYLRQIRPHFGLYVTPLNMDPLHPSMPISTPESFAMELAEATGRFYTQGMPEDTKAYEADVLSTDEFLSQTREAQKEIVRQYWHVLDHFEEGLLFYYFGGGDQVSHMAWRPMDLEHPAYRESDARFADVVKDIYVEFDGITGETLKRMPKGTLLIVMSDHGFTSWRRAFHLNTWLKERGYLALRDPNLQDDPGMFGNVDWSRTRAYGLGLNGLYVNQVGRERDGIVDPAQREALLNKISEELLGVVDPQTGQPAITRVLNRKEYKDRGQLEIGPDLVIGYAKRTRGSNESALGKIGAEVFTDNTDRWNGDHCMDPDTVPGILLTNRPLKQPARGLEDLSPAILAEYGIEFPVQR